MSKRQIVTTTETITPEWAQEQLDELDRRVEAGKFRQRPIREAAARRYAIDMRKGKWILTHQGIAFDVHGNLLDGQNRLYAVTLAGVPVEMRVTRGLPIVSDDNGEVATMDAIDNGAPRSVWQALQISHGYGGSALELSSAARNVVRLVVTNPNRPVTTYGRMPQMSTGLCLEILEKWGFRDPFERLASIAPFKAIRPVSVTAPWAWLWKVQPKKAEAFARDYQSGENLGRGHPALLLYRYISQRALRRRVREPELMAAVANALKSYLAGETISAIKPSDEAHVWLLKLNWPLTEKITEMVLQEKAVDKQGQTKEEE